MSIWSNTLETDLAWREAELASLKVLVASEKEGTVRHRVLLRSLWCILYAHFEGFYKFAWDYYLESLEHQNITREQAQECLAKFSLKKNFSLLRRDTSDSVLWLHLSSHFEDWMSQQLTFKERLETESNLWPSVAKGNNVSVGLPYVELDSNDVQLRSLVSRRNEIAHGKPLVIKKLEDYQPYEQSALLAMHELAVGVLESLEMGKYLRSV